MRSPVLAIAIGLLAVGSVRAAGQITVNFNPKGDFKHYNTWAWAPDRGEGHHGVLADPTMRERVEHAISVRLKTAGLVPTAADRKPDLLVRYQGDVGDGKEITTSLGAIMNLDDPMYATLHFTQQDATLMVDLIDASNNLLVWRLYVDETIAGPNDESDKFAKALDKGFAKYPPSAAEVERKAKEIEKASRSNGFARARPFATATPISCAACGTDVGSYVSVVPDQTNRPLVPDVRHMSVLTRTLVSADR